jgi:uncharacterized protein YggE
VLADGGLPNQPYIYVEGQAETEKPADFVALSFRVVGHNAERPKANAEAQDKVIRALAMLKEARIAESDIVAENLSSEPDYENDERGRGKLIGYNFTRPIDTRVRDIPRFAKLVDDLIGLGGIEFAHIEGGLSKQKEIEDELWQKALINARERAEKTLKPMGMKIDSVFAVSPIGFAEIQSKMLTNSEDVVVMGSNVPAGKERAEPSQYRLAPVTVIRTVRVIYLTSPVK